MENYIHPDAIKAEFDVEIAVQGFDDVPALVARKIHEESESTTFWADISVEKKKEKISNAKKRLNKQCVEKMTPQMLDAIDLEGDVRSWLSYIASQVGE